MARRVVARMAAVAAVWSLAACGGAGPNANGRQVGETSPAFGGDVSTWAQTDSLGRISQVGVTLPMASINGAPAAATRHTGGPAGAAVTLNFPAQVITQTLFNHFEMQWEPQGHPPAKFQSPHFDLHFYGVPEAQVAAVNTSDTAVPAANRVPQGYSNATSVQDYQAQIVPQMGFHSVNLADVTSPDPFTATMVVGFYGGSLTFLEPMVTQAKLQAAQSFSLAVPQPAVLGRVTLYPTQFNATFNPTANAYDLVFSNFVLAH